MIFADSDVLTCKEIADTLPAVSKKPLPAGGSDKPLPIEDYIKDVVMRYQDRNSEIQLANMLGIGRKALWVRRRRWGLFRNNSRD